MAKKRHHASKKHHSRSREINIPGNNYGGGNYGDNNYGSHVKYERERKLGGDMYDVHQRSDYEMVGYDRHDHANLPTNVIMKEYPMSEYADFPYLDDTARGIDNRSKENKAGMRKGLGRDIKY